MIQELTIGWMVEDNVAPLYVSYVLLGSDVGHSNYNPSLSFVHNNSFYFVSFNYEASWGHLH